ncbi:MAG: penicillin-binding protein [Candidatus Doudnabacteria bacterium]|nr:penicillin-binding protein [Candidatus Doudnabacteria bacterium]
MNFYRSNWNRNHRMSLRKILWGILKVPPAVFRKIRSEKKLAKKLIKYGLFAIAGLIIAGSLAFAAIALSLPDPTKLNARVVPESTKIYARDGTTLLYEIHGEAKRTVIDFNEIPDRVKKSTIAVEDKNFYRNTGVDWKGIIRAALRNVSSGNIKGQGGSTITQQFVKNAILTREKTFSRKIKEIVLAIQLEQKFSKNEILNFYLNEIPYGQNAYGIEAASQTYFGKQAKNLSLAESAYLAALPQAPTFYSPNGPNRDKLDARKNFVLDEMRSEGYITDKERDDAKNEKVTFNKIRDSILAPHFVLYVQGQLAEKYGEKTLEEGGLKVITSLDWNFQQIAEKAVSEGVARNEKRNKASNAALVAIDPKTGQILSMVGSREYLKPDCDYCQVNVALRELQPGSSIKPYVYATAFKEGMNPATMLVDVKTSFGTYGGKDYSPSNYDGRSHGLLSMRKALAGSLNVPAVKTLALVGVQDAIDTIKDMGITADLNTDRCGLSLVLGGCEISLLDHTSAMGVFAGGGVRYEPTPILKITDRKGKVLEEYKDKGGQEVIDPQVAYQVVSIMTDNDSRSFIFGAKSPLILSDRVVAAKTGTTQGWRDGWTMGFTPSLVAGVWVGNNDGSLMREGADGVVVAAPIWNQFMREALKNTQPEQFLEPAGIQHILVDSVSGKLPTQYTPSTKTDVFASFALPRDFDDVHVPVQINKLNGKLANNLTPPELVETKIYTIIHSEVPDNPNWEIPVQSWAKSAGYSYPQTEEDDGSINSEYLKQQVGFITPSNNQEIPTLPITVQVETGTLDVSDVELMLEGEFLGNDTSAPYSFFVDSAKSGWQTMTAIVKLKNGDSIQNSIRINVTANANQ